MKKLIIAVDFDGTCVTHEYPKVGRDIGAAEVLKELMAQGHKLILWTLRSGPALKEAADWCHANGIELFGINRNPQQGSWSTSPKAYANLYIDDAALGAPLLSAPGERPHINWFVVKQQLRALGYLPYN